MLSFSLFDFREKVSVDWFFFNRLVNRNYKTFTLPLSLLLLQLLPFLLLQEILHRQVDHLHRFQNKRGFTFQNQIFPHSAQSKSLFLAGEIALYPDNDNGEADELKRRGGERDEGGGSAVRRRRELSAGTSPPPPLQPVEELLLRRLKPAEGFLLLSA